MKKLLVLLALLVSLPVAAKDDVLHLYNWNNYMSDETVKRFEDFCKCKVKQTYYSRQRRAARQAPGRGQGLRRHRADDERGGRAHQAQCAAAARQGASCRT